MRVRWPGVSAAILLIASTVAIAQSGGAAAVSYRLRSASTYTFGCFAECDCPTFQAPLEGTFRLRLLPTASPFDVYAIERIDFLVPAFGTSIDGSGFYRPIGTSNDAELDLRIDEEPLRHFGSGGFVPQGAGFPDIDIVVSVNQMQSCHDWVLHVVASPDAADGVPVLDVAQGQLSWSAVPDASGYDAICGDLELLRGAGDFESATDLCLGSDLPPFPLGYDLTPDPGRGMWFLVRETGGSYDSGGGTQVVSRDPGIEASGAGCP